MTAERPVAGQPAVAPTFRVSAWLFLRLLGITYLVAFLSLWAQLPGLLGRHGVLPAAAYLEAVREQVGDVGRWQVPTLCWIHAGDGMLQGLCGLGMVAAGLLILGVAPVVALALLWVAYLSLVNVGQDFLHFQWDSLLLETGWLAIFLAPIKIRPRRPGQTAPSRWVLWLLWWLLVRLMVSSGAVKLLSGDPAWRGLTALQVHYETQPLPTWIGWYAHQLPPLAHRVSAGVMFVIELIVPVAIVVPGRARRLACAVLVAFQGLILVTGNYTYFNLLTIALCLLLLDDGAWPMRMVARWWPGRGAGLGTGGGSHPTVIAAPAADGRAGAWPRWVVGPVAAAILGLTLIHFSGSLGFRGWWPRPVWWVVRTTAPFHLVNRYGLFAIMTMTRHEIIIEGSRDGAAWVPYEFRWKPGRVDRAPAFVAPHQPRLDWQMWFAALGSVREHPWLLHLCGRLLEGRPEVLTLLASNPFPDGPPRYVRAVVYDYRFTDLQTKRQQGTWWRRTWVGPYLPPLVLDEGRLAPQKNGVL